MKLIRTELADVVLLEPQVFEDARGLTFESYNKRRFRELTGVDVEFVQDNRSRSAKNVLRGLHYQVVRPQGKLVGVLSGRILDVMVDLRDGSPTFGKHVAVELSGENGRQLFGPRGFAHGFVVLSEQADVFYKCDRVYSPADEIVLAWNDPALGIDWPVKDPQLSARDAAGLKLADIRQLPRYEP
jgi:dTDP-4-dehydrorhamnose 3,5-epimerase